MYTHRLKDQDGNNTCPFLAVNFCPVCATPGHTASHCKYHEYALEEEMVAKMVIGEPKEGEPITEKLRRADLEIKVLNARESLWADQMRIVNHRTYMGKMKRMIYENRGEIDANWFGNDSDKLDIKHKMFCRFCHNKDRRNIICLTHNTYCPFTGKPMCPNLLCNRCGKCGKLGHTTKFCGTDAAPKRKTFDVEVFEEDDEYILDFTEEVNFTGSVAYQQANPVPKPKFKLFAVDFKPHFVGSKALEFTSSNTEPITEPMPDSFKFKGSGSYELVHRKHAHALRTLRFKGSTAWELEQQIGKRRRITALPCNMPELMTDDEEENDIAPLDDSFNQLLDSFKL